MIVLVESLGTQRAPRQPEIVAPEAGARWGKPAAFGGGISQVSRSNSPVRIRVWNLSPVWRAYDVVKVPSEEDPSQIIEATVTRQMLVPVDTSTQKYVGGGIGYVEDPGDYGYQLRTIHTFVLLTVPSPLTDLVSALVLASGYYYPTARLDAVGMAAPAVPLIRDVVRYTISPILSRLM